jgi:hypothetical protein
MSTTVSQRRSGWPVDVDSLPTDREGRARWLADREDMIAGRTVAALRSLITDAFTRFTESIVASADYAVLDVIPSGWLSFLTETLVDDLGDTYQAGQMTAWLGMKNAPTQARAEAWAQVVNQNAVSYMGQATNRLVGVGDATWQLVRKQATAAVTAGLTVDELREKILAVEQFSVARAETIARTETVGAYVQGDLAGAKALGDQGPVEKVWVAATDKRTRETHVAAHDQCVPFDEPFMVGDVAMEAPHDPGAPAGEVVNCRCIVEFLYLGDTRPDGSVIEAPVEEAPVIEAWEPPAFTDDLSLKPNQPTLGGAHRKMVLSDGKGNDYLFKPQTAHVAHGEAAASEIALRAGLDVPRVHVHTYNGEVGTLQRMIPNARPGFPGPASGFDPTKITVADLRTMQDHRALDWMIGNHDAHAGQFVREGYASSGGRLIGIDKGQAFKHFGSDELSHTYHPNGKFGEAPPVHNLIEDAYRSGRLPDGSFVSYADTKTPWRVADELTAIPDDEYRSILLRYAEGQFPGDPAAVARFLDMAVDRKNSLRADMAKHHKALDKNRTKLAKDAAAREAAERARLQALYDANPGGPRGMSGAPVSQNDTAFMAEHDHPITSLSDGPNAYRYTQGSGGFNTPLRRGQVPDEVTALIAELGTTKKDFIVHRGMTLEGLLPPGGRPALQGGIFRDPAFMSTSTGGKVAPGFKGDTELVIRVNAGTRGSYLEPISAFKGGSEKEFLLAPGQHLYVHKVEQVGGRWRLDVEVVEERWAQAAGVKVWDTGTKSYR